MFAVFKALTFAAHRAGSQLQDIALFLLVVSALVSSDYLVTRKPGLGHTIIAFELFCIYGSLMQNIVQFLPVVSSKADYP